MIREHWYLYPSGAFIIALAISLPAYSESSKELVELKESEDSPILEELRVTASRLPKTPASLDVRQLDAAEPAFVSQNSLGSALQGQHGITFTNTGGPGKVSTLRIRGEEGNRTTVLIDGIELSDVSTPQATTNIQHLMVAPHITSVDVLAGPQAFFLGGDAGGVVNIRTSLPSNGNRVSVAAETGSDNQMVLSALGSVGTDSGGLVVSGQKWRTAGFNSREDDVVLADRDGYDNVTLHGRGHYRPTDNSVIDLVIRHVDAETDFDNCGFPRSDDCVEDYEQFSARIGAVIEGERLNHRISASINQVDRENFAADVFSFGAEGNLNKYEYGVSGTTNIIDFAGGVELRQEDINDQERDQWGVFGEAGVVLDSGLSAGLGLRFDDNDDFGTHLTGRTGELREERSRGLDVGVSLDSAQYSASLTYFNQRIEDAIFFDLANFSGFLQSDGTSRSTGFTARGRYAITPELQISGDYLFNRARQEDGLRRLRRPRNSGRLSLAYTTDRFSAGATVRFVGEVEDEVFLVGRQTLDDYTVVDLTGSYRFAHGTGVFAGVRFSLSDS